MKLEAAIALSDVEEATRPAGKAERTSYDRVIYDDIKWFAAGWYKYDPKVVLGGPFHCHVCGERHTPNVTQHTVDWEEEFSGSDPHWTEICLREAEKYDDWEPSGDRLSVQELIARAVKREEREHTRDDQSQDEQEPSSARRSPGRNGEAPHARITSWLRGVRDALADRLRR